MIKRIIVIILTLGMLAGCATSGDWNPASAAADANRDITSSKLRFAYVGGFAPRAPGLPETDDAKKIVNCYGRLEVGPQGCIQDEHFDQRIQYARRYNRQMWHYVASHQ